MTDLNSYPAYDPKEVLRLLLASRQDIKNSMTVYLSSGLRFFGELLQIEKRGIDEFVVMTSLSKLDEGGISKSGGASSFSYFALSSVLAVEVHSAEELSGILSEGPRYRSKDLQTPSKLDLRRRAETAPWKIVINWDELDGKPREHMFNVEDVLKALLDALTKIGSDQIGKKSFEKWDECHLVFVSVGSDLDTKLANKRLTLEVNLKKNITKNVSEKIQELIERLL